MMTGGPINHDRLLGRIEGTTHNLGHNGMARTYLHRPRPQMDLAETLSHPLLFRLTDMGFLSHRSPTIVILRRQWAPECFQGSFSRRRLLHSFRVLWPWVLGHFPQLHPILAGRTRSRPRLHHQ